MKIIVTTFYYSNYSELAKITVTDNLALYCFRQGYEFIPYALTDSIETDSYKMACKACVKNTELILGLLESRPDCDYVFHRDCDSIIMNMNRKLEDIVAEYPYDIVTGSDKAGISAGQMLVKNTVEARAYLRKFLNEQRSYEHEQDYMGKNPKPFLFATPQNVMNSYDCMSRLEPANTAGNYREGDFLVHLAGLNLEQKMEVVNDWMRRINFNG